MRNPTWEKVLQNMAVEWPGIDMTVAPLPAPIYRLLCRYVQETFPNKVTDVYVISQDQLDILNRLCFQLNKRESTSATSGWSGPGWGRILQEVLEEIDEQLEVRIE